MKQKSSQKVGKILIMNVINNYNNRDLLYFILQYLETLVKILNNQ